MNLDAPRAPGLRCSLCHEAVSGHLISCEGCGTLAHVSCAQELSAKTCPTPACKRPWSVGRPRVTGTTRRPWREHWEKQRLIEQARGEERSLTAGLFPVFGGHVKGALNAWTDLADLGTVSPADQRRKAIVSSLTSVVLFAVFVVLGLATAVSSAVAVLGFLAVLALAALATAKGLGWLNRTRTLPRLKRRKIPAPRTGRATKTSAPLDMAPGNAPNHLTEDEAPTRASVQPRQAAPKNAA